VKLLASILKEDLKALPPVHSPIYCRPLASELAEIQERFPLAKGLPIAKKHLDSICAVAMRREWFAHSTPRGRAIKPVLDRPRYISVDPKPVVGIRARLRLSSALTPKRRFTYKLVPTNKCECGMVGDTDHVLMHCQRLSKARLVCSTHLLRLLPPVVLTRDVILGLPPPIPVSYVPFRRNCPVLALRHEQCLFYTGKFIEAIDRRFHL